MNIDYIKTDFLSSKMYIISKNDHCFLVDTCGNDQAIKKIGLKAVDFIFLTHEHFDHISGTNYLCQKYSAPVLAGDLCSSRLDNPILNGSHHFNAFACLRKQPCNTIVTDYICKADRTVEENSVINWEGYDIHFLYTPGHMDSCFSIYIENTLFVGDAILFNVNGNPALPDYHFKHMFYEKTVPLLSSLPKDTTVYPGHGNQFLLGDYLDRLNLSEPI